MMARGDAYSTLGDRRRKLLPHGTLLAAIGIIIFLFLICAWVAIRSPLFFVKSINIQGNSHVSEDSVRTLLLSRVTMGSYFKHLLGFKNILTWPDKLEGKDLIYFPWIKSITIEKGYGNHSILVAVAERKPLAIWCLLKKDPEKCYWFDEEGIVLERAPLAEGNLIQVVSDYASDELHLGWRVLKEEMMPNMASVLRVLLASGIDIKEIRLDDLSLEEIKIKTLTGPDLYFSLRFTAVDALPVLNSLRNGTASLKNLQYVDFRSENRAYYK